MKKTKVLSLLSIMVFAYLTYAAITPSASVKMFIINTNLAPINITNVTAGQFSQYNSDATLEAMYTHNTNDELSELYIIEQTPPSSITFTLGNVPIATFSVISTKINVNGAIGKTITLSSSDIPSQLNLSYLEDQDEVIVDGSITVTPYTLNGIVIPKDSRWAKVDVVNATLSSLPVSASSLIEYGYITLVFNTTKIISAELDTNDGKLIIELSPGNSLPYELVTETGTYYFCYYDVYIGNQTDKYYLVRQVDGPLVQCPSYLLELPFSTLSEEVQVSYTVSLSNDNPLTIDGNEIKATANVDISTSPTDLAFDLAQASYQFVAKVDKLSTNVYYMCTFEAENLEVPMEPAKLQIDCIPRAENIGVQITLPNTTHVYISEPTDSGKAIILNGPITLLSTSSDTLDLQYIDGMGFVLAPINVDTDAVVYSGNVSYADIVELQYNELNGTVTVTSTTTAAMLSSTVTSTATTAMLSSTVTVTSTTTITSTATTTKAIPLAGLLAPFLLPRLRRRKTQYTKHT